MNKKADFYYTISEAAKVLGRPVPTVYRWVNAKRLTAIKNPITGLLMISREEVEEAIEWA